MHVPVSYERPGTTREVIGQALDAGFGHLVRSLPAPCPDGVARWVAEELIAPSVRAAPGLWTGGPPPPGRP